MEKDVLSHFSHNLEKFVKRFFNVFYVWVRVHNKVVKLPLRFLAIAHKAQVWRRQKPEQVVRCLAVPENIENSMVSYDCQLSSYMSS